MDTANTWVAVISNLGFPIFVAVYLLIHQSTLTRQLTQAIRELSSVIENCKWRD